MVTSVAELAGNAAFPPVAISVIRLLVADEVDWNAVNEAIRSDVAFTAHVLQRANSPQFGFATRIDHVPRALQALGVSRARKLVLTACASAHLGEVLQVPSLRRCWRHAIASALLTEELAWACSLSEERAFASGLLHDIGRLILIAAFPEAYATVLAMPDRNSVDLLDCERDRFGLDHCEAGRELAEHWKLPQDLLIAAGRHHDTPFSADVEPLLLVHLGCRMADALGFAVNQPPNPAAFSTLKAHLPEEARQRLHPDAELLRISLEAEVDAYDSDLPEVALPPRSASSAFVSSPAAAVRR